MEKTKRKSWLITGFLAIALVFTMGFAFLGMPANTMTAYAATTVGQDATLIYNGGGVQGYTRSIASQTASSGTITNTNNGITYSWNGAAGDANYIMINAGATYTVTATNIPNVDHLLYARLMIYQPTKYPDLNVTMGITFGTKSASYNLNTSTQDSYNFYPDLKGGNGNSVTWTVKNNSGSAAYISQGYCDLSVARNYTVNFDKKGGSNGTDSTSVWHYFSYSKITAPTKTGYKFLGYFDAETGGTKYFNADGTATKNAWDKASTSFDNWTIKLYAQWELMEFDVTLNDNGGTGGQGSVKATSTMSMPNLTKVPTRTGYSFQGYYDAKSGGTKYFDENGNGVGTYNLTKATTVYARWDALKYTATFDSTNGTGGLTSKEFTYDSTLPDLTSEQFPTRESSDGHSYSFGGYFTEAPTNNADGSQTPNGKQYYNDLGKGVGLWKEANDTTTLYAYWTIDMTVSSSGFEGTWDGEAHGITIDVASPEDTTIYYGNTASTCNNTNADDFLKSNAGNYTIFFEVKKYGYTTYRHSETIVINKAESVVSLAPTSKTGLEFTNEDQELITAGIVDYGNMLYAANTTGELPEASEFSADIPTGKLVGTYYVFYKSSGDGNHNEIGASEDNKVEVLIAEVDKTALLEKINEVSGYVVKIDEGYGTIAATLEGYKQDIGNDFYNNPNVTVAQVASALNQLDVYLVEAYNDVVDVVDDLINAIPTHVGLDNKEAIDVARAAYDDLIPYQKSIFQENTLKTLEDDEKAYESMDKVHAIGTIENTQESEEKIVTARETYDALTTDQKALVDSTFVTDLENAETVFAVIEKVNAIGKVEYNDDSKALIEKAREEYENLSEEQKQLFPESAVSDIENAETTYATIEKNAKIISIVFLILSALLLIIGIIVMILLLRKRKELKRERDTKLLSVAGLPLLLVATSHYLDAPFIALYVLAFLTVCVWVADLIIYLKNRKLKQAISEAETAKESYENNEEQSDENGSELDGDQDGEFTSEEQKKLEIQRKLFYDKLKALSPELKSVYRKLKSEMLSYDHTKLFVGKGFEYVTAGRNTLFKFAVKGKILCVYFELDAENLSNKFKVEKVNSKKHASTPCLYKIKNERRLNLAKQLVAKVAEKHGLKKG